MRPVEAYVDALFKEIAAVRALLPADVHMSRLHLGGGTPTILPADLMAHLLDALFDAFGGPPQDEFSVEIDPTDAAPDLLQTLVHYGLNRASLGVQDFAPAVQQAIGRLQSLEQTRRVIDILREAGVKGINIDLLYGLPHQTMESMGQTLTHVIDMTPDRLAIYGYAHVPWMSKRQVMIEAAAIPDGVARYHLATLAQDMMLSEGFHPIGIDHFARPSDSLFKSLQEGRLRRNFQGYTDDASPTLVGLGASAISRFTQGYVQNAVSTSAWQERVGAGGLAGHKGYCLNARDALVSTIIEDLMCRFDFDAARLQAQFPDDAALIARTGEALAREFRDIFTIDGPRLQIKPEARALVRIVAHHIDDFVSPTQSHSAAI